MNAMEEAVKEDIRCHLKNGVDLNPFSTARGRTSWDHGFAGVPETYMDWSSFYERGRLAAQLMKEHAK